MDVVESPQFQALQGLQYFVDQMVGFYAILDLSSRFILLNEEATRWTGLFTSEEYFAQDSYIDIKSPLAECSEFLTHLDQVVGSAKQKLTYLAHFRHKDSWRVVCGDRLPFYDAQGEHIGFAVHAVDVTHSKLLDYSNFITEPDFVNTQGNTKQFVYVINNPELTNLLTPRQLNCLFFLVRGKSIKEIAAILELSPRTVEVYIDQAKQKLDCCTRSQLIEKTIVNGYANTLPINLLEKFWRMTNKNNKKINE